MIDIFLIKFIPNRFALFMYRLLSQFIPDVYQNFSPLWVTVKIYRKLVGNRGVDQGIPQNIFVIFFTKKQLIIQLFRFFGITNN